jgi:hypothetical protein
MLTDHYCSPCTHSCTPAELQYREEEEDDEEQFFSSSQQIQHHLNQASDQLPLH